MTPNSPPNTNTGSTPNKPLDTNRSIEDRCRILNAKRDLRGDQTSGYPGLSLG